MKFWSIALEGQYEIKWLEPEVTCLIFRDDEEEEAVALLGFLIDGYLNNYFDFHVCLSFRRRPSVRPSAVRPSEK